MTVRTNKNTRTARPGDPARSRRQSRPARQARQTRRTQQPRQPQQSGLGCLLPFLFCLLTLIILGIVGYSILKGYPQQVKAWQEEAKEMVEAADKDTFVPSQTGAIYDTNGKIISEIASDKIASYVPIEKIPKGFVDAMVGTEDRKFYRHHGVDYLAIVRAALSYITNQGVITQGGSTITMQLARNVFLSSRQTAARKAVEIFIAQELEKKYTKDEIMEFYLNNIYFANGYYGVQAACKGYFNCKLSELSISQIAFLCAIPNSPTYYDPVVNKEHTLERRNRMLKNMHDAGLINDEEYLAAATEDITLNRSKGEDLAGTHNYIDTYACHCAALALMETEGFKFRYDFPSDKARANYEEEYDAAYSDCRAKISSGKYKLYTSIDTDIQEQLQQTIDHKLSTFFGMSLDGEYMLQGAGVCIDNATGRVIAEVGGRTNSNFSGYTLNRVYQSYRQPGSTIKPLIVYAPLFETGEYTPNSYAQDRYTEDGPKNASGSYWGTVTLRTAVEQSINTVAWNLYQELGPENGLAYLKKMHFTKIVDADVTPATAIGGFTIGATPAEMTAGYAALANNGMYREPTCIKRIENYEGEIIYESEQEGIQVYSPDTAHTMTDVLRGVITRGTGAGLGLYSGIPAAGKTGTTDDTKDGWFIGYTHYYTTGIWVGCNTPQEVEDLHGSTFPGEIWNEFMNNLHDGLEWRDLVE